MCVPACPKALAPATRLRAAPRAPRAPVASAPASYLRAAPVPPRVTWDPAPAFWLRAAPELPRVTRLRARSPQEESSGAATYPTAPSGLWTIGTKKGLVALVTQLASHVSKARSCVTEAPARHADRPLQFDSIVQRQPS
jgi:hypothetical protein